MYYCLGLPHPSLGEGKNYCLALSTHTWPQLLGWILPSCGARTMAAAPWGERLPQPAAQEALRSRQHSRVEEQPCWAKETKFTLSCSFKTTDGQGGRVAAPAVWSQSRAEKHRACLERRSACLRTRTQHKGTSPMAGHRTQPERYRGLHLK